jgi:hypothetical protein
MANLDNIVILGTPNRELPGAQVNNAQQPIRTSRYMEPYVHLVGGDSVNQLADEGTYYTATNATLGTALSGTAAPTAFSATVALLSIFNSIAASAALGKSIFLHWLQLEVRAAGTNGTSFQYAMSVDTGNRFASGGTAITPVNPNIGNTASSAASIATVNFGAITAAAANNARRVKHGQLRSVIKVIGDVYLFTFGRGQPVAPGMVLEGSAQAFIPVMCPPVVLGPNSSFLLHEIAPSQSVAATYEFSAGWWER